MRKNLFLAFVLVMMTFSFSGLNAEEFQKPTWRTDFKIEDLDKNQEEESIRLPSSGSQEENKNKFKKDKEEHSDVENWKFEPKQDY